MSKFDAAQANVPREGEAVTHELKTIYPFMDDVIDGRKCFEVRKADRDYRVGDTLLLTEYYPETKMYGDYTTTRTIVYILAHEAYPDGIREGYAVLGIAPVETTAKPECFGIEAAMRAAREGKIVRPLGGNMNHHKFDLSVIYDDYLQALRLCVGGDRNKTFGDYRIELGDIESQWEVVVP